MAAGHSGQCTACIFCHHSFASHEELVRHIVTHRQEERPFECRICRKTFKQQAHRDAHIRTHTNDRLYICEHCGQLFKQFGHLKCRILRRHTDRALLPHVCSKCSQKHTTFMLVFFMHAWFYSTRMPMMHDSECTCSALIVQPYTSRMLWYS